MATLGKVEKKKYSMCNLVIRKMAKKTDAMDAAEKTDENAASYRGITLKTVFFIVMCFVGVAAFFLLHSVLIANADAMGGIIATSEVEGFEGIFSIETCLVELIIFAFTLLIALFAPLFAWLIRPTIPYLGTVYAICEGYFVGMVTMMLAAEYKWIPLVAFIITAMVVGVMLFIYVNRIIKVTSKFKKIVLASFISILVAGLVIFLLSLIPTLNPIIAGMLAFLNIPIVSIILSVVFIIIAALFLLFDFDAIESCVENKMPKKLEWMAAFGLVYTVIYIYFKILQLIIKLVALSKGNS